jgi:Sap, sulfolipid-1-addressing protein
MGLILPIFFLALLASISPVTLVVFILLLATTRARLNAGAFLVGWAVSLTVVFSLSYLLGTYRGLTTGGGGTAVAAFEVLVGGGLVATGVWQWRRRNNAGSSIGVSKDFAERLKGLTPRGAAVLGVLKQPWSLTAAAALVLVHHHSAFVVTVIAFGIFAVVSSATVCAIYVYYARDPAQADTRLQELYARVVAAGPTVLAVASLLIGAILAVDGFRTLAV